MAYVCKEQASQGGRRADSQSNYFKISFEPANLVRRTAQDSIGLQQQKVRERERERERRIKRGKESRHGEIERYKIKAKRGSR